MIHVPAVKLAVFIECIRKGMYIRRAAAKAGFNQKTYHDWVKRAESDPESYPEEVKFLADCAAAEADGVESLFDLAHGHAETDPATTRWLLGLKGHIVKKEVKVDATVKQPVKLDLSGLSIAELRALRKGRGDDVVATDDPEAPTE